MSGSPRPSGSSFSRDVPRVVQRIVGVAREHIAPPVPGERGRMRRVDGGMLALHRASGNDSPSSTRDAVCAAEGLGLMRRSGATWRRQVYVQAAMEDVVVAVFRRNSGGTVGCAFCGSPTTRGQWCPSCQPAFRRDRAWRATAVNLLHEGASPSSIAQAVGRPIYPQGREDLLDSVVGHLLAEVKDLVPVAYVEGLKLTLGAEVEKVSSILGGRARQRRHRASM